MCLETDVDADVSIHIALPRTTAAPTNIPVNCAARTMNHATLSVY